MTHGMFFGLVLALFVAGCATKPLPPVAVKLPTHAIDYQKEVKPVLDKRCTVCHFLLQLALPAQTRLLRRCRPRRHQAGHIQRRAAHHHGPNPPLHRRADHRGVAQEAVLQRHPEQRARRVQRLDHDPAALPQDEDPQEPGGVPPRGGRPDLLREQERTGRLPGKTPQQRHALRLSAAQAGRVRHRGRLAAPGRARADRRPAGGADDAEGCRCRGHRTVGAVAKRARMPNMQ